LYIGITANALSSCVFNGMNYATLTTVNGKTFCVTPDVVKADLQRLYDNSYVDVIRTYQLADCKAGQYVLDAAVSLAKLNKNINIVLGVWLTKDLAKNERELGKSETRQQQRLSPFSA
jgi:exo-beta-1,3-glucanase (GH17 family)